MRNSRGNVKIGNIHIHNNKARSDPCNLDPSQAVITTATGW